MKEQHQNATTIRIRIKVSGDESGDSNAAPARSAKAAAREHRTRMPAGPAVAGAVLLAAVAAGWLILGGDDAPPPPEMAAASPTQNSAAPAGANVHAPPALASETTAAPVTPSASENPPASMPMMAESAETPQPASHEPPPGATASIKPAAGATPPVEAAAPATTTVAPATADLRTPGSSAIGAEPGPFYSKHVSRGQFTRQIENREPQGRVTGPLDASRDDDVKQIYFFTELVGMSDKTVTHRWRLDGEVMAEIPFRVGSDRWRVYSSKYLTQRMTGVWQVEVVGADGQVLARDGFAYRSADGVTTADQTVQ